MVLHNQEGPTPDASPAGEGGAEAAGSGLPRLAPECSVCPEIQNAFVQKLAADAAPLLDPKIGRAHV